MNRLSSIARFNLFRHARFSFPEQWHGILSSATVDLKLVKMAGSITRTSALSACLILVGVVTLKEQTSKKIAACETTYRNSDLHAVLQVIEEQWKNIESSVDLSRPVRFLDQVVLLAAEQAFGHKNCLSTDNVIKQEKDSAFLRKSLLYLECAAAAYYDESPDTLSLKDVKMFPAQIDILDGPTGKPSFFIATCPDTNALVVSIRGTANLADILTNMLIQDSEPVVLQTGDTVQFHNGILQAAEYVLENISCELAGVTKVVFTGHSLGGGVAQVCGLLLETKMDVEVYSFAAPPVIREAENSTSLLSEHIATSLPHLRSYNFILDKDLICHLSAQNISRMLRALKRIQSLNWTSEQKMLYIVAHESRLRPHSFLFATEDIVATDLSQGSVVLPDDFTWQRHISAPPNQYFRLETPEEGMPHVCHVCRGDPALDPIPLGWRDFVSHVMGHTLGMYDTALRGVQMAC